MANDVITAPAWMPKQTQTASTYIRYGLLALMAIGALKLFNGVAPDAVTALALAEQIFENGTHALMALGGLIATYFVMISFFSKNGILNRLFMMAVNAAVLRIIRLDPVQPIKDRIAAVLDNKATVDASKSKVRGTMRSLQEKSADFRGRAKKAQDTAIGAHGKPQFAAAEQIAIRQARTYADTADKLDSMYHRMEPVYQTLNNVSQACDVMAQNLQAEAESLQAMWEGQKAMGGAVDSANEAMGFTHSQQWNMANEAENIIKTKYGEELGRLDDLTASIEPTMQSISLEDATFSEELFSRVQEKGGRVVQMTQALPPPGQSVPDVGPSVLSSFIRS
jgi:hypothetical protein